MNLFSSTEDRNIVKIATAVLIEGRKKNMLLECISDEFLKSRLESYPK